MAHRSIQAVSQDVGRHAVEIERNRKSWAAKPCLREAYHRFHGLIAARIDRSVPGLIVELGSGMGAIKEAIPDLTSAIIFYDAISAEQWRAAEAASGNVTGALTYTVAGAG